jgi:hypothetical protein
MEAPRDRIDASPSKAFFIDMLTRDIGVPECILDLIDNSVDKAVQTTGFDAMSALLTGDDQRGAFPWQRVDVSLSPDRFEVIDNCGGISVEEAERKVFLFGDTSSEEDEPGLSVYGIGLKRAVFKLGSQIAVSSTTANEHFKVVINVAQWRQDEHNWRLPFEEVSDLSVPIPPERAGTMVVVEQLNAAVAARFSEATFVSDLLGLIGASYALFLRAGLKISVNGQEAEASLPSFAAQTITPARREFPWDDVSILILAGVAPPDGRSDGGWYVFCNGRMVLQADKTSTTGWGEGGSPQFHVGKHRRFLGYAYFRSEDVAHLPWRTTKQGVDTESMVYRAAVREMRLMARPVLDFLNGLYPSDVQPEGVFEREVLRRSEAVEIMAIPRVETSFRITEVARPRPTTQSIQYRRPIDVIQRIKDHLDEPRLAAGRIGELTFDYYVEHELD